MVLSYTAGEKDTGRKVYSILRHELKISETLVRRMKRAGAIRLSGELCYTDRLISAGETLTADIDAAEPDCDIVPEEGELDVIYEDAGLLALNKPTGLLVHPSHSRYTGTLANFAAGYLSARGEPHACHAVNRLDRDTGGVVLFAKNTYMKSLASDAMHGADKYYIALACGEPLEREGTIDLPIKRLREGDMLRVPSPDGQRAVTHYKTLAAADFFGERVSLLSMRLETGRTHQIRVHAQSLGFPLLGDKLYSTGRSEALSEKLGITAQALHAERLELTDPVFGERLRLCAPLVRDDMLSLIGLLQATTG